ncbi:hypothetical protein HY04AAS1_0431 [Hydrogenobaculum sp. Y04AAS1]|uniref:hypothetical protein n=1 Tax=Hydrogenobaculum sp. (strain Y04AAS1) TaxID=380749 RepID=UPI00017BBE5B|nr:hypothetical protein HY04AAS1_0431 [Hydrogenobaculum sp. Y04AAS1]
MLNVLEGLGKLISKIDIPIPKTPEDTTQNNTVRCKLLSDLISASSSSLTQKQANSVLPQSSDFKDILDSLANKKHLNKDNLDKDKVLKDLSDIFQDIFNFFKNITNTLSNNTSLNKNQGTEDILIKLYDNAENFAVNLLKDIEKLSKDINPNFDTNSIENIIKNIQNHKSNETFLLSISIREEIITTSKNASNFLDSILSNLDKHILSQKDISSHISSLSFSLILEKENTSETLISLKAQKPNLNNLSLQTKPLEDIKINVYVPNNIKTLEESDIPSDKIISKDTQVNTDKQLENQQTKTEQLDDTKNITYKFENVEINIEINNNTNQPHQAIKEYEQLETYAENTKNQVQEINTNQTNNEFSTINKSTTPYSSDIANESTTIKNDITSYKDTTDNNKNTPTDKDMSVSKDDLLKNNQIDIASIKDNNLTTLNEETKTSDNKSYYKNVEEQELFTKKDEIQPPKETNVAYYKENEKNIKDYIAKNVSALNLDKELLPKTSLNNLHDFTSPIKDIMKESLDFQAFNTNDKQKDNKDNNEGFSTNYQQNIQTNQQNTTNSINTEKIFKEVEKTVLKETKNPVLMKNVSIQLDDGTDLQIKFNANNLSIAINTNTELVYKDSQIKDLLKNLQNLGFSVENITINGTTIESQMGFSQDKEQGKDDKEDYKKQSSEESDFEFINAI